MADAKLTALNLATPVSTDIVYFVSDPAGSPLSKKATLAAVATLVGATAFPDIVDTPATLVAIGVDVTVPDEAYGAGWNGSLEVPTKNALYDKIETISAGGFPDITDDPGVEVDISVPLLVSGGLVTLPFTAGSSVGVFRLEDRAYIHSYTNAFALAAELAANGQEDAYNTFIGVLAGNFTSTGIDSTASGGRSVGIGYMALNGMTTGYQNTAIGHLSGKLITTGISNTSIGSYSLATNTASDNNTAIGSDALWKCTGYDNTAIGKFASQQNTDGHDNVAVGSNALVQNTTGSNNTAVGSGACGAQTSGGNTAFGHNALRVNQTGSNNLAIGEETLRTTTGASVNTALGNFALFALTDGTQNVAAGYGALESVTTGSGNIGIGRFVGDALNTGSNNVLLGLNCGDNLTSGSNNIMVGANVDADSATGSDQLNIGGLIKGDISAAGLTASIVAGANGQLTNIKRATVTVNAASAATLTATNLIPAGSVVIGVSVRVTTTLDNTDGLTTFSVGDGTDPDRWGTTIARTAGTTTTLANATIASVPIYAAATSVVLTSDAGTFNVAAGVVRVTVHYINLTAAAS